MSSSNVSLVSRQPARALLIASAMFAFANCARADELVIQGMSNQKVTIVDFKEDRLIYQTPRGDQSEKKYETVKQIIVEGETALNDAEKAFSEDKKPASIDGYIKAVRSTAKPWVRAFASRRLLDATSGDSKRFDGKLAAYIGILLTSPETAAEHKPTLPEKGNKFLDTSVTEVETALKQPKLEEAQTLALLNFLIEIHRQRGDDNAVTATVERMAKASPNASNDPAIKAQLASLKVTQAKLALDQRRYADAAKLINDNRAFIADPRSQSDALYILAVANLQTANKADKTAMTDAALMFMRVVANSNDIDDKPNVLPSLVATADILKQIDNKSEAIAVYEQIARDFPEDPAARTAKGEIEKLKKE